MPTPDESTLTQRILEEVKQAPLQLPSALLQYIDKGKPLIHENDAWLESVLTPEAYPDESNEFSYIKQRIIHIEKAIYAISQGSMTESNREKIIGLGQELSILLASDMKLQENALEISGKQGLEKQRLSIASQREWRKELNSRLTQMKDLIPWDQLDEALKNQIEDIQLSEDVEESIKIYRLLLNAMQRQYQHTGLDSLLRSLAPINDQLNSIPYQLYQLFTRLMSRNQPQQKREMNMDAIYIVDKFIRDHIKDTKTFPKSLGDKLFRILSLLHEKHNNYAKGSFLGGLKMLFDSSDYDKLQAELTELINSLPSPQVSKPTQAETQSSAIPSRKVPSVTMPVTRSAIPTETMKAAALPPEKKRSSTFAVLGATSIFSRSATKRSIDPLAIEPYLTRLQEDFRGFNSNATITDPNLVAKRIYEHSKTLTLIKETAQSIEQREKAIEMLGMINRRIDELMVSYQIPDPRQTDSNHKEGSNKGDDHV